MCAMIQKLRMNFGSIRVYGRQKLFSLVSQTPHAAQNRAVEAFSLPQIPAPRKACHIPHRRVLRVLPLFGGQYIVARGRRASHRAPPICVSLTETAKATRTDDRRRQQAARAREPLPREKRCRGCDRSLTGGHRGGSPASG